MVTLRLFLPYEACPIVIDHAVVQWVHNRQLGIEFQGLLREDIARLHRFLIAEGGEMPMIEQHERRKAARLPIDIPVDYLGKEFLGKGTVINVSPHGVLIRGDYLAVVGTNVSLRMFAPDDKEPLYVERAVVRWRRGAELGVEIMTMAPDAHARLVRLMTVALEHQGGMCAPKLPW